MDQVELPVFAAFGEPDDHLRLTVLLAKALQKLGDARAARACLRHDVPWSTRCAKLGELRASLPAKAGVLGVIVDLDALHPGKQPPAIRSDEASWDDPSFRHERLDLFKLLVTAVRRGGWLVLRPAPDPELADDLEAIGVPASDLAADSSVDAQLAQLAPTVRPLFAWLRRTGVVGARGAERIALLRPPQHLNGHLGPFAFSSGAHALDRAAIDQLAAAGLIAPAPHVGTVYMPTIVRRFILQRASEHPSERPMDAEHRWLAKAYGQDLEGSLEAHHHAVAGGDENLARAIHRSPLRDPSLRAPFGRAPAHLCPASDPAASLSTPNALRTLEMHCARSHKCSSPEKVC